MIRFSFIFILKVIYIYCSLLLEVVQIFPPELRSLWRPKILQYPLIKSLRLFKVIQYAIYLLILHRIWDLVSL